MSRTEDFTETFANMETQSFKNRIYETCELFAMEYHKLLSSSYGINPFPSETFHTIDEREIKIFTGPPKKGSGDIHIRLPITEQTKPKKARTNKKDERKSDKNEESKADSSSEDSDKAPTRKAKAQMVFNRNTKTYIDFIISRFLWEIYSIGYPIINNTTNITDINYVLDEVPKIFTECNITSLVIQSVKVFQPNDILPDSYGLDRELRYRFDEYTNNITLSDFAAKSIVNFLKLLIMVLANKIWDEKSRNINADYCICALRFIGLSVPNSNRNISKLLREIYEYDAIINVAKPKADDKADNPVVLSEKTNIAADDANNDPEENKPKPRASRTAASKKANNTVSSDETKPRAKPKAKPAAKAQKAAEAPESNNNAEDAEPLDG
jgi:hypothetical protein